MTETKSKMILKEIRKLSGSIEVITGLHIGGSSDVIEIGGMDNPIIKNPQGEPYIPGSSLKGKMRSLMEMAKGKVPDDGKVHSCNNLKCPICRVFGSTDKEAEFGPTRILVRDARLSEESRGSEIITEEKYENTINRVTAVANPRPLERVVPGTKFDFEILYRVFDTGENGETDEEYFSIIKEALDLIEHDALGGSGSRGSGQIKFHIDKEEGETVWPGKEEK